MISQEYMVQISDLSVSYRQRQKEVEALRGVSFAIPRGSTCALIGPSGCGKSTLLGVMAGLITGYGGRVAVDGRKEGLRRRQTALILQDYGLLPWKRVADNVGLGLEIRRVERAKRRVVVQRVLEEVGLWEMRDRFPSQLSGGQRQRVGIARALALDPDLLLMDEPFSSLDALTRESMQRLLLGLWQKKKMTVVLVTHGIEEAVFLGRQIVVLSGQPGQVLDLVDNPLVGEAGYQLTPEFHGLTTRLREKLVPLDHGAGAAGGGACP